MNHKIESYSFEYDVCEMCLDEDGEPTVFKRSVGCLCKFCKRKHWHQEYCRNRKVVGSPSSSACIAKLMHYSLAKIIEKSLYNLDVCLTNGVLSPFTTVVGVNVVDIAYYHIWVRNICRGLDHNIIPYLADRHSTFDIFQATLQPLLPNTVAVEFITPPPWES